MDGFRLNNGRVIPQIGFGTFRIPNGEQTERSVIGAIEAGYRHIDGAAIYANEKSVGDGIRQTGVAREELFITSKLWNNEKGYESTLAAFERTLNDLQIDYLDLYLIHWPIAKASRDRWQEANNETWKAFEELYGKGKIKTLGVSNFQPHHLEPLMAFASVKPVVNQIEFHPGWLQEKTVAYCAKENIMIEAWAPFFNAKVLNHPVLTELAGAYGKSVAQLILRWILQKNFVSLPKSVTPQRIKENLDVFDFEIGAQDTDRIDKIDDVGFAHNSDHIDF